MAKAAAAPTTRGELRDRLKLTGRQLASFLSEGGSVKLTRVEAARRLGVSPATLYRLLSGQGPYQALFR